MNTLTTPSSTAVPPVHLSAGALRLVLAPDVGGSIAAFYSETPQGRRDWLRPASNEALHSRDPLGMSSFPLIPFCNRIRDGRSHYGARPIDMLPNLPGSPHTIHGTVWRRACAVESQDGQVAVLSHQHRPEGTHPCTHDWPYAFDARIRYELHGDALHVEVSVTNRDEHPMPAGMGHHPYFPHRPGTRLTTHVSAMWASDDQLLPTGLTEPPFLRELAHGIDLARIPLDNNFVGWSREARVDWPTGDALVMRAEPPLDYFVLYSPAGQDHFCMEPVSNCTDWMNLAAQGVGPVGGTLLPPNETAIGRFELRPLPKS